MSASLVVSICLGTHWQCCHTHTHRSWKRDKSGDEVPGNLYAVKFGANGNGLILGNDGLLLRYATNLCVCVLLFVCACLLSLYLVK
jgi:hypothetical protein